MMLGLLPLRALLLPQLRQLAFKCHFLVVPEKIFLTLIFLIWKLFSIVYNEIICHAAFNIFLTFVVSRELLREEEDFLKCVLQSSINTKINKMSRHAIFYVKIWMKWIVFSPFSLIQPDPAYLWSASNKIFHVYPLMTWSYWLSSMKT